MREMVKVAGGDSLCRFAKSPTWEDLRMKPSSALNLDNSLLLDLRLNGEPREREQVWMNACWFARGVE